MNHVNTVEYLLKSRKETKGNKADKSNHGMD